MADRVLVISWGESVRGREERGLEVFNEALGIIGRMQQDGRIESFDVVLFDPNGDLGGYIQLHGSAEQLNAVVEDEEFIRNTVEATLIVDKLRHLTGYTNEGVAQQMALYQEAIAKVPQAS
jgi:hypothetical protein